MKGPSLAAKACQVGSKLVERGKLGSTWNKAVQGSVATIIEPGCGGKVPAAKRTDLCEERQLNTGQGFPTAAVRLYLHRHTQTTE